MTGSETDLIGMEANVHALGDRRELKSGCLLRPHALLGWRQWWEVKIDDHFTCVSEITKRRHHMSHQCVVLCQFSSGRRQAASFADDFGLDSHWAGASWP